MKKLAFVLTLLLVAATNGSAWAHPSIDVAVANWRFTPDTITLHVGETTTLRFTSSEGVHGVQSDELSIKQTVLMPNKFVDVTFTPTKPGTYKVHCSIICGGKHGDMILTIKVES